MSITFPNFPKAKSANIIKPLSAFRQSGRQVNLPKTNTVSNEQIAAVNTVLQTIEREIYYSALNYVGVAHSPGEVEVKSPGVGQRLKPVYLPIVYNIQSLVLPRNGNDTYSESSWDLTRQKLDQLRRHQSKELCIQSDTLYIVASAKQDVRTLDIVHQVYIGDRIVGEAFATTSTKGAQLYYRILGGHIVSKVLYQEFLVRLPRSISRATDKMREHGYVIPSLLGDEFLGVTGSRVARDVDVSTYTIEPRSDRLQAISQLTQDPIGENASEVAAD